MKTIKTENLDHKKVKDSKTAMEAYRELKSVWSSESSLRTKATILILRELEKTNALLGLALATPELKKRAEKAIRALEMIRKF